jgi:hypothetical protein
MAIMFREWLTPVADTLATILMTNGSGRWTTSLLERELLIIRNFIRHAI